MNINIISLKTELNSLNNLVENYKNIYLNIYNEFSCSNYFWNDANSKKFYADVNIEKIKVKKTINEFESLVELYQYIISSYEKIGDKISYDLKMKDEILNDISEYKNNLSNIIKKYNNIKKYPEVSEIISNEIKVLDESIDNVEILNKKINNFYETIGEINKTINIKISKIDIEIIKENNVNNYV